LVKQVQVQILPLILQELIKSGQVRPQKQELSELVRFQQGPLPVKCVHLKSMQEKLMFERKKTRQRLELPLEHQLEE